MLIMTTSVVNLNGLQILTGNGLDVATKEDNQIEESTIEDT